MKPFPLYQHDTHIDFMLAFLLIYYLNICMLIILTHLKYYAVYLHPHIGVNIQFIKYLTHILIVHKCESY